MVEDRDCSFFAVASNYSVDVVFSGFKIFFLPFALSPWPPEAADSVCIETHIHPKFSSDSSSNTLRGLGPPLFRFPASSHSFANSLYRTAPTFTYRHSPLTSHIDRDRAPPNATLQVSQASQHACCSSSRPYPNAKLHCTPLSHGTGSCARKCFALRLPFIHAEHRRLHQGILPAQ